MSGPIKKKFRLYKNVKNYDKQLEKGFQAVQLLVRNEAYLRDIEALRNKYSLDQFSIEEEAAPSFHFTDEIDGEINEEFGKDVEVIANKIHFPGRWIAVVSEHAKSGVKVEGLTPFGYKMIEAIIYDDHTELKLFGDVTTQDLRSVMKEVRKLQDKHQNRSTNNQVKYKARLDKNLLVFDKAKGGVPYKDIARYCNEEGIQRGMQYADVSKYVEQAEQQIAKIYA